MNSRENISKINTDTIVVVCAADNQYAMSLCVTLYSIVENLSEDQDIEFFIIDGGITARNKRRVLKSLSFRKLKLYWTSISSELIVDLPELKPDDHISTAAFFRLFIPELIPSHVHKVIYLDSDLIVLRNLKDLWSIDVEDFYLLACQDGGIPYVSSSYGLLNYKEIGIPEDTKYFNSGVLVINVKKWREDGIKEKIIEYIRSNKENIRWHDQDVMNAVLARNWKELDAQWNQIKPSNSISDAYIVHFASSNKPWNSSIKNPANFIFFEYLDKTAWLGWRLNLWRRFLNKIFKEARKYGLIMRR